MRDTTPDPGRLLTVIALLSCLPAAARAQHAQYFLPVERAELSSHVELQLEYAQPGADPTVHHTVVSVEGQVAWANRLEVSLDVPFLFYSFTSSDEETVLPLEPAQVGDMILGLKGRLYSSDRLTTAAFIDTRLPLHSGLGDRNKATFQSGGAVTLTLGRLHLGGTLELLWFLRTANEDLETEGRDFFYLGVSLYADYTLFGIITGRLAVQYYNSVHPDGDVQVVGITPALAVHPLRQLELALATRVAPTDHSWNLLGGRASLLFSTSYRFD